MSLFGEDPRDSEIEFLRTQVLELQKQLVALTSERAHRVLYPVPERARTVNVGKEPAFRRNTPFRPSRDREDQRNQALPNEAIHGQFRADEPKATA